MSLPLRLTASRLAVATLLVVASSSMASAQNLIVNPHFDTDISGWSFDGATGSFDGTRDANGSLTSGAGQITNTLPSIFKTLNQCITGVTPGTTYDFGAKTFFIAAPDGGSVGLAVAFFTSSDCTSGPLTNTSSNFVPTTGAWLDVTGSIVAPAGAVSALVLTGAQPGPGPGVTNIIADFDDVFFQASSAVPAMPTATLAVLGIGLALLGYRTLARRRA